jgi:hypothetical protein
MSRAPGKYVAGTMAPAGAALDRPGLNCPLTSTVLAIQSQTAGKGEKDDMSMRINKQVSGDLNTKYAISRKRFICGPMLTETFLLILVCSFHS